MEAWCEIILSDESKNKASGIINTTKNTNSCNVQKYLDKSRAKAFKYILKAKMSTNKAAANFVCHDKK